MVDKSQLVETMVEEYQRMEKLDTDPQFKDGWRWCSYILAQRLRVYKELEAALKKVGRTNLAKKEYTILYWHRDPIDGYGTWPCEAKSAKAAAKKFKKHCKQGTRTMAMADVSFEVYAGRALFAED